jgi:hypothetical protein
MPTLTASAGLLLLACLRPSPPVAAPIALPSSPALAFSSGDGRVWVFGQGRLEDPLSFEGKVRCPGPAELDGWERIEGCSVAPGAWGVAGIGVDRVESVPFVDSSYGAGEDSERAALVWNLPTCGPRGLRLSRQRSEGEAWVGSLVCGEQAWWLKPDQGVEAAFLVDEDLWVVLSEGDQLLLVALGLGGMRQVLVAPRPGAR